MELAHGKEVPYRLEYSAQTKNVYMLSRGSILGSRSAKDLAAAKKVAIQMLNYLKRDIDSMIDKIEMIQRGLNEQV